MAGQIAAAHRQRRGLRGGAPARRGAGRARPRQDRVLLQRQPRVPHAADADARAARGRAGRTRGRRCPQQRERCEVAHRNGLRLLKLVNTLLDFSRIEAGRVAGESSSRPTSPRSRAELASDLPLGDRARRPAPARSTARRCPSRSTSTATCGRRSSSTCSRTPSSSPSRARSRSGSADRAGSPSCAVSDTGTGIPRRRAAAPVRALPSRRGRARPHASRARHRPRAGAGAGRSCTAARSRVESAGRPRHHLHGDDSARAAPPAARRDRRATVARRPTAARSRRPTSRRRCAGCPRRCRAPTRRRGRSLSSRRAVRASRRGRARILLADDNADMRDYVAPAARRAGYEVEAVADGEAALAPRGGARPTSC